MFDISGFIGKKAKFCIGIDECVILGGRMDERYLTLFVVYTKGPAKGEIHSIPSENLRIDLP